MTKNTQNSDEYVNFKGQSYFNLTKLKQRGWTSKMIDLFLGNYDCEKTNPFYRSAATQKLYLVNRVLKTEKKKKFLDYINKKNIIKEKKVIEVPFKSYLDTFSRQGLRKITLITGPTNSGKTYDAISKMIENKQGAYLAPLRLMALEKYKEISTKYPCSLITGEDKKINDHSQFVSQTIETYNSDFYNTIIIDEFQMISDPQRGNSWLRAFLSANCDNLIILGSNNIHNIVQKLVKLTGEIIDKSIIKERLSILDTNVPYFSVDSLPPRSLIGAFSRRTIFQLKNELESKGKKTAVIYGALSAENKIKQAQKYESGECDYLVATDAIGMGLNLSIEYVFFYDLTKFDGVQTRELNQMEINQIAGRAGRYKIYPTGYICSFESQLYNIRKALTKNDEQLENVGLFPSFDQIQHIQSKIKTKKINKVLEYYYEFFLLQENELFQNNDYTSNMKALAKEIDKHSLNLDIKYILLRTEIDINNKYLKQLFNDYIKSYKQNGFIDDHFLDDLVFSVDDNLKHLENLYSNVKLALNMANLIGMNKHATLEIIELKKEFDEIINTKISQKHVNLKYKKKYDELDEDDDLFY